MDPESHYSEPKQIGSSGHSSRLEASFRRSSSSQTHNGSNNDYVFEAAGISDHAINADSTIDFQIHGFLSQDPNFSTATSPMENISPLSTDPIIHSEDKEKEYKNEVPWLLDYISRLLYLAVFGILGKSPVTRMKGCRNLQVLTRYLLKKLCGPEGIGITSDDSYMYPDLPPNVVGSFLMGWFGVVFKKDIVKFSDQLAVGITTGYLGSLTTFSGWNQSMLDLSVNGKWVFAVLGFVVGLALASCSIVSGIESAYRLKWIFKKLVPNYKKTLSQNRKVNTLRHHFVVTFVLLMMLGLLWGLSGAFLKREFNESGNQAELWLACLVGPVGVWVRWLLARLNGRGLGKTGSFKWIPFGTLLANVLAVCIMAALATTKRAVKTKNCNTIATGIQLGVMGCLSTVSTFIAEFRALRQNNQTLEADAYAMLTIILSFILGTLIYSVPVWTKGYQ